MIFLKQKIKTYKSCDSLWKYNFDKILETENYKWLIYGYGENNEISVNEKKYKKLEELWKEIFNEYVKIKGDQSVINNLRKRGKIENLKKKLFWGTTLLSLLIKNYNKDVVKELHEWGFKIDSTKDIKKEIERITGDLKGLKTRLNLEISKYESILERHKSREKINTQDKVISVSRILDLKFPINVKETTVSQWISYIKQAENTVKQRNGGEN